MTKPQDRKRRGCLTLALGSLIGLLATASLYAWWALGLPEEAPLARMYRTEAEMAGLSAAIDAYRVAYGVFPPAGPDGLRRATDLRSHTVNYYPDGPPHDGWDRPFRYVPHGQYADPGAAALRSPDASFYAPRTFQLYSVGADGQTGLDGGDALRDNIMSWDPDRPWRPVYRALNRQYLQKRHGG